MHVSTAASLERASVSVVFLWSPMSWASSGRAFATGAASGIVDFMLDGNVGWCPDTTPLRRRVE